MLTEQCTWPHLLVSPLESHAAFSKAVIAAKTKLETLVLGWCSSEASFLELSRSLSAIQLFNLPSAPSSTSPSLPTSPFSRAATNTLFNPWTAAISTSVFSPVSSRAMMSTRLFTFFRLSKTSCTLLFMSTTSWLSGLLTCV